MLNMPQHILITGASSGIGAALAEEMAQRGFVVGLVARREPELRSLCKKIIAAGGQAGWATGDVADFESIAKAIGQLESTLGPVEILVANAGISARSLASDPDLLRIRKVMDVNYFGAIHSAKAVLPGMLERKRGHLVVISSVAGFRGLPKSSAYSSSKAAITNYWESQRLELAPHGIACTSINPGYIQTPLTDKNKHPMPFLISAETAAITMANGILSRRKVLTFPWRMRFVMGIMRLLPTWIYDRIMGPAGSKYR
jgi:short-subunit dehydrogenase